MYNVTVKQLKEALGRISDDSKPVQIVSFKGNITEQQKQSGEKWPLASDDGIGQIIEYDYFVAVERVI